MTWECAECQASDAQRNRIDAVCHHCGKLLCRQDRQVIADVAFDPAGGEANQTAVHCRACLRRYHTRIDIPVGVPDQ
jgi:hypothetical protein